MWARGGHNGWEAFSSGETTVRTAATFASCKFPDRFPEAGGTPGTPPATPTHPYPPLVPTPPSSMKDSEEDKADGRLSKQSCGQEEHGVSRPFRRVFPTWKSGELSSPLTHDVLIAQRPEPQRAGPFPTTPPSVVGQAHRGGSDKAPSAGSFLPSEEGESDRHPVDK